MELKQYLAIIWRRKWILIVTVMIVPLFAYVMMKVIPPIYKSETKIWVNMNTIVQKFFKDVPDSLGKIEFTNNDNALGTMEEILNNSESIERVIKELGLTNKKGKMFTPDEFTNPNKVSLILHLQEKGYGEEQISDSDVIKITGYSTNPAEAKAIANRVAQEFLSSFSGRYKEAAMIAGEKMLMRLHEVERELGDATRRLESYKIENRAYSITTQILTLMTEISALQSERDKGVRSLQTAETDLKNIKNASLLDQNVVKNILVKVESSAVIESYKTQLLALEMAQAKLAVEKTREHPDIKIQRQQIEKVQDEIRKEIAKSFPSQITGRDSFFDRISAKYSDSLFTIIESTVNIKIIDEQINERKKALIKFPEMERRLNELQWDIDNLKPVRDLLRANYETTKNAENIDFANPFVIQPPTQFESAEDNQYFPPKSKKFGVAVATFLGLLFGLFLVFFVEYWSSGNIPDSRNDAKKTDQDDKAVKS